MLGRKFQDEVNEPSSVSWAARSARIGVEEEEYVEQQAIHNERLKRSMVAVTCELSTENTSRVAENVLRGQCGDQRCGNIYWGDPAWAKPQGKIEEGSLGRRQGTPVWYVVPASNGIID